MRISDWSSDVCSSDLAAYYSAINHDGEASAFWKLLRATLDDSQARVDIERAEQVIARRKQGQTWAESVAGRMELHYSPGRTWEATERALIGPLSPGEVTDIGGGERAGERMVG